MQNQVVSHKIFEFMGYKFSVFNDDPQIVDEVISRIQSFADPTSIPVTPQYHGFEGIVGLTQITIPNGVTRIGEMAFLGCFNLQRVTIPISVTSIGNNAFYNCNSLQEIRISESLFNAIGPNIRIMLGLNNNVNISIFREREEVPSQEKNQDNMLNH